MALWLISQERAGKVAETCSGDGQAQFQVDCKGIIEWSIKEHIVKVGRYKSSSSSRALFGFASFRNQRNKSGMVFPQHIRMLRAFPIHS